MPTEGDIEASWNYIRSQAVSLQALLSGIVASVAQVYTKTYNTAARVIPNATAVGVATTGSSVGAATSANVYAYTTQAQADAIPVAINANAADILAVKKVVVALVTDLETAGIIG